MSSRKNSAPSRGTQNKSDVVDQGVLLQRAISWIINDKIFSDVRLHGNVRWLPQNLIMLAVLTAWSDSRRMTDCFAKAAKLSQKLLGVLAIDTFQGMVRALASYGPQLIPRLWCRMQTLMEEVAPEHYRIGKWLPLAVDGSRFTTPRTKSNERAFAAKIYGQGNLQNLALSGRTRRSVARNSVRRSSHKSGSHWSGTWVQSSPGAGRLGLPMPASEIIYWL